MHNPRIKLSPIFDKDSQHSYTIEYVEDEEKPMVVFHEDSEAGIKQVIARVKTRNEAYDEAEAHYENILDTKE